MTAGVAARLETRLKQRANELGFDPVGLTRLGPAETHGALTDWLARGYAGEMTYIERGAAKRADSRLPAPGTRAAVVVGMDYGGREPAGPVARYARGEDYHDVMIARLQDLHRWLEAECGHEVSAKAYVDTGPILERDLARKAGLGWIGKNTMLVNPRRGSFFFLGALLVDLDLEGDAPFEADHCGSCRRCIDACPTEALVAPRVMDARRCISYLTIEHRSAIPDDLQPLVGDLLYGCDICQDVCPFNRKFAKELPERSPFVARAALAGKDARALALELLDMSQGEYSATFKGSPMKRAGLRGLRRNAAVVLANTASLDLCRDQGVALAAGQSARSRLPTGTSGRLSGPDGTKLAVKPLLMAKRTSPAPDPTPASPSGGAPPGVAAAAHAGQMSPHLDEGLFRLLVASVSDYAIVALDRNGVILSWNDGARRLKGYVPEEIIGKHFSLFYPPEDIARGKPDRMLDAARTHGHVEDEGWRIRKDGTRFWANVIVTALRDDNGELVGFAKITRDLTERRATEQALRTSEERFRLIVSSVKDYGILMLDARGHIISWNEGAQRITGYTAEEIAGRHFSIFYPQRDINAGKPAHELKAAIREGRFEDEDWRVRKDGSLFWANVVVTAIRNDQGELIGFAKITRDLTERRAAEQRAIEDARRVAEAEASNRAKGEFLAAMSHELRTPLNAIGGYAELIKMGVAGPVTEQQREYLDRVRGSQQHLLAIVNDLLNYTKVESGQLAYEIENVDLHGLVESVLAMVTPQAAAKRIRLVHGRCNRTIARADRLKVEQIVLNLLSNAVKFTPIGGNVSVTCGFDDAHALLAVKDDGAGIPADKFEAIFEPFVQLGRTLSSIREGTGLGLAISRDLARAMDGNITVTSTPGRGSTFRLILPRA